MISLRQQQPHADKSEPAAAESQLNLFHDGGTALKHPPGSITPGKHCAHHLELNERSGPA
jgi:hypothetical protein